MSTLSNALEARSDQKDETYFWLPYEEKAEIIETISTAAPDSLDWIVKALPSIKNRAAWLQQTIDRYAEKCTTDSEYLSELATLTTLIAKAEGTPEEATK